MPIYEYRCEPCQHTFEAFLATSADAAACPRCEGAELTRLMSMFASSVPGGRKGGGDAAPAAAPAPGGHVHRGCCGH
jgi:putative FmdB family regulatory protein